MAKEILTAGFETRTTAAGARAGIRRRNTSIREGIMTAKELYDILSITCGAPTMKEDFLYHVGEALQSGARLEYRFIGHLGFGGKLWLNDSNRPYVTCYKEDETPGRLALIEAANEELARVSRN